MSVEAQSAVWLHSEHKGNVLLTLVAIADNADGEVFEAYPSYDHLAAKTRLGKRTVQDAVKKLLASDELTLVERGTQGRSNVYRIEVQALRVKPRIQVAKPATSDGERDGSPDGSPGGGQAATQPSASNRQSSTVSPEPELPSAAGAADDGSPQLFEAPPAPKPGDPLDPYIVQVFDRYMEVFGERKRIKHLTPEYKRTIRGGLLAVGGEIDPEVATEICLRAISGLKSYRRDHPDGYQGTDLSDLFTTSMHTKFNRTEWIERWANYAKEALPGNSSRKVPVDLVGVPSVTASNIRARRREVVLMYDYPESAEHKERGMAAVDWLKEHIGHRPKIVDGEMRGWELIDD